MKIDPAPLKKTLLILLCLFVLQVSVVFFGKRYWLNVTASVPVGVYRLEKLDSYRGVKRGDMVVMAVPDRFQPYVYGRKWLPKGWPLIKHAGAVAGDLVCCKDGVFTINGVLVGHICRTDREGLPLPHQEGCARVPAGYFVPVATGLKNSFDGRYMGPVSLAEIAGVAKPVLVFEK